MTEIGELIAGRYRLVDRIAVGGMGVVWEGWDELLARRVAVKQVLIQPGLSEADALLARHRVIREARITARLHHPHAVTIYDVVDDGDYPCLIMQFVPSSSLNGLLRELGTLPPPQVGRIGADLASALHAAHQVGIVHRDVKPGNVLITDDGSAKLTDFGISHAFGDVTLTSTGMVSGTPAYLAPEVARGGTSGFPADVFSLGATLYASLEGTPPFGLDANPMAVLHKVASGQVIPPRQSGPLTPLLMRMLAPEPADRPTMADVTRTLTLPTITPPHPPWRPADKRPEEPAELPAETPAEQTADKPAEQTVPTARAGIVAAASGRAVPRTATTDSERPSVLADLLSTPQTMSAAPAPPGRRRMTILLAAVVTAVVAAAIAAGLFLFTGDNDGQGSVAAPATQTATQDQPDTGQEQLDTAPPTTILDPTPAPTSESPQTSASTADPAAELVAAVNDYYALMPANTDAGWSRLTPNFQAGIAQNREYYDSFWGGVSSVTAGDVTATGPNTVEATISYTFTDGSVSVERTAYQLVQDGAEIKIDSSSVLSSQ